MSLDVVTEIKQEEGAAAERAVIQSHNENTDKQKLPRKQRQALKISKNSTNLFQIRTAKIVHKSSEDNQDSVRFTGKHFPRYVPVTSKANPTRRCAVCTKHKIRKESRYMCSSCQVALCVVPCFEEYHTNQTL